MVGPRSAEAWLTSLPSSTQAHLESVARAVMGMSRHERVNALAAFNGVATAFLDLGADCAPVLDLMASVGELIQAIDEVGFPREQETV